ncbi:MAG: immunoglobulin domain-containing protein, partial [Bacteroidota bacterium]
MKASIRNIGKNRPANNFHKLLTACFVYVAIFLSPLSTVSQTAPVLEPLGGFAIDGDLQANTPVLDIGDWVMGPAGAGGHVLHNDGSALDSLNSGLFLDNYDGNDMIFQGSKFNQNPDLWSWSVGKANSKNDINNVMYHLAKDGSGNMWIMLGSDRLSTSGTSYIDFEFLQNPLVRTSDFGFNSAGPHGGRTINDMIVSVEYSNGGSAGNVRIYLWEPVGTGYDYVEQTIPAGIAFASTNSSTVPVPFGAFGSTSYSPYQFAEAAVNISDLFGALDPCLGLSVKTIIVKTKASTSQTANLGDFAEPIQVSLSLGTAEISYNNNMDLCPTGTVSPVINGVEDGTFSANPSGLSLNTATGEIDLDNSLPGDYTITYSFITNGCPRTADTDITILESPEAPVSASSDSSILCADHADSLTLSAAGGSGDVLNWYSDACQGNLIGTGNNLSIPAPSSTTTYYAAWENSCG